MTILIRYYIEMAYWKIRLFVSFITIIHSLSVVLLDQNHMKMWVILEIKHARHV